MITKFLLRRKLNILCTLAAFALLIVAWVIAYYSVANEYIIPSVGDTLAALGRCFKESSFWISFLNTLARTIESFVISFLLAAVCAAGAAVSKIFAGILQPIIVLLRTLPTLAVILIIIVWTNAKVAPVIVSVLVMFPMIYAQFSAAIAGIDGGLKEMCKVYEVSKKDRLFKVYLPLISPNVLSQTGANVSLGLKLIISAEVLSNTFQSLGGLMQSARAFIEMPRLAALTIASVILGLILDVSLSQLKRLTYKWNGREVV